MDHATFTLIIWLWMGVRFEETRMLGLTRVECHARLRAIQADGRPASAACLAAYSLPALLPGRRRV